ncbi:uncharacterized protein LOC134822670 [Bolinopsis microptera]|uniref:uncharacterized protein LOC134822670 n=1 Tax=Bolinopsis microptera TaxID=2820187 RepID=UPI003079D923
MLLGEISDQDEFCLSVSEGPTGLAEQLSRAIKTEGDLEEPSLLKLRDEIPLINNLYIFPAPTLLEVSPGLEVPDLLSENIPLCLLEELFFPPQPETAQKGLELATPRPRARDHCHYTTNPQIIPDCVPLNPSLKENISENTWYDKSTCTFPTRCKEDKVPWRHGDLKYDTWADRVNLQSIGHVTPEKHSGLRAMLTEPVWMEGDMTGKQGSTGGSQDTQDNTTTWSHPPQPYYNYMDRDYTTEDSTFTEQVNCYTTDDKTSKQKKRCLFSEDTTSKQKKRWRRKRTVFSPAEIAILEGVYEEHKFLNPTLKASILSRLNVASNVVVMWFQNRRAKDRATGILI